MGPSSFRNFFTRSAIPSNSARSKGAKWKEPGWPLCSIAAVSSGLSFRAIAIARKPASANLQAIPNPNPRLPPVTITLRMVTDELSSLSDRQRGNEVDDGRDLVRGEFLTAEQQDGLPYLRFVLALVVRFRIQHNISNHQCAGDGIFSGSNQRHTNFRMAIYDRFDFFRMDLQAADIDDPVAPADEIVAVPTEFEGIACIH